MGGTVEFDPFEKIAAELDPLLHVTDPTPMQWLRMVQGIRELTALGPRAEMMLGIVQAQYDRWSERVMERLQIRSHELSVKRASDGLTDAEEHEFTRISRIFSAELPSPR